MDKKPRDTGYSADHESSEKQCEHPPEKNSEDKPEIFGLVIRGMAKTPSRREFIKKIGAAAGVSALGAALLGCGSEYDINSANGDCTCHVVCGCDTQKLGDSQSTRDAEHVTQMDGEVCTCNTVCTCNLVCTCDTVCNCDSEGGGGGGGSYYYTYYYPN